MVSKVCFIGAKAAASNTQPKHSIQLITVVQHVVNNDPDVGDLLKAFLLPNYNVSLAEVIIPANDFSERISTAGIEASVRSNMKFVMNGELIIGTIDEANIEIREEIGEDNMLTFGLVTTDIRSARHTMKYGEHTVQDVRVSGTIDQIKNNMYYGSDT